MSYVIQLCVFIIVLITYLHIQSHFRVSSEFDVFELYGIIDARIDDVLDLKQPVVFRSRSDAALEEDLNIYALLRTHPDTDVYVVDSDIGTRVASSIGSFVKLQDSASNVHYYSDGNENVVDGLSNESRLRITSYHGLLVPTLACTTRYDLIFGTDGCSTHMRRHVAHRSYFTVTNGTVMAKLIHPDQLSDVSFDCTPDVVSDSWSSIAKTDTTTISIVKDVSLNKGQTLFVPPYWGVIFQLTKDSFILSAKYSTYMSEMATCLHTGRFWYNKLISRPMVVPDVHMAVYTTSIPPINVDDNVNVNNTKPVDGMEELEVSDSVCINNDNDGTYADDK